MWIMDGTIQPGDGAAVCTSGLLFTYTIGMDAFGWGWLDRVWVDGCWTRLAGGEEPGACCRSVGWLAGWLAGGWLVGWRLYL